MGCGRVRIALSEHFPRFPKGREIKPEINGKQRNVLLLILLDSARDIRGSHRAGRVSACGGSVEQCGELWAAAMTASGSDASYQDSFSDAGSDAGVILN